MAEPQTMLVRITPTNPRESHYAAGVHIKKADGWCEVPTSTAKALAKERMNALNPAQSAPVFEVSTKTEAQAQEEAEKKAADKPGSVAEPKQIAVPEAPEIRRIPTPPVKKHK